MPKESAGLLMYAARPSGLHVLVVHPGGPFWANMDAGAWSVPKGELEAGDDALATAIREFEEEIGRPPRGPYLALGSIRQKSGKAVHAWAFAGEWDSQRDVVASNTFELEWPPRSGRRQAFPEVDRAELVPLAVAREKLNAAQVPFVERLAELLAGGLAESGALM